MKIHGRKVTKSRIHAYDVYKYLVQQHSKQTANKFVERTKRKHPRIYIKELEPYVK